MHERLFCLNKLTLLMKTHVSYSHLYFNKMQGKTSGVIILIGSDGITQTVVFYVMAG
jgi:hypothetical protein